MFVDLDQFDTAVRIRLGPIDATELQPSTDATADAARAALIELSDYCPRRQVYEQAGDGSRRFVLPTILTAPAWINQLAALDVVEVVLSANTDDEERYELTAQEYEVLLNADGDDVLYLEDQVTTSQTLRLRWSLPHTIDGLDSEISTTLSAREKDLLLWFGAAHLAEQIARRASDKASQVLGVDQFDHTTIAREWSRRAKELRDRALKRLSGELQGAGAGVALDWDSRTALGDTKRFSH